MLRTKFNKNKPYWLGEWYVDPVTAKLLKEESEAELEPEAMKILSKLVESAGIPVGFDELEASAWDGIEVGVQVVTDTILAIRKALDDDPKEPKYIETVPNKGFRLSAKVYHKAPSAGSEDRTEDRTEDKFDTSEPFGGGDSVFSVFTGLFSRKKPLPDKLYTNFFSRGNPAPGKTRNQYYAYALLGVIITVPALLVIISQKNDELPLPQGILAAKQAETVSASATNAASPQKLKERSSIAIDRFSNMDSNPAHAYFGDGIARDLTSALSAYSGLHVVSSDALQNGQATEDQPTSTKADYLLKGDYRLLGSHIDVKVRLIDTESGDNVWEDNLNRKSVDVFEVQAEIRDKIIDSLSVRLTDEENSRVWTHGTHKFEAYNYFLRGQYVLKNRTSGDDNNEARKLIKKAISLDSGFARAHAVLAIIRADAWRFGWTKNPDQSAKLAVESGELAVNLDSNSPQAHWSLGYVYLYVQGDHERAIEMGERVIELDSNSPEGYTLLSVANLFGGNPAMARLLLEGVKNNNPQYRQRVSSIQALSQLLLGNHKASLDGFIESLSIDSAQIQSNVYKAIVLYRMGEAEDAKLQLNQLTNLHPEFDARIWAKRQPFSDKRIVFGLLDDLDRAANL